MAKATEIIVTYVRRTKWSAIGLEITVTLALEDGDLVEKVIDDAYAFIRRKVSEQYAEITKGAAKDSDVQEPVDFRVRK